MNILDRDENKLSLEQYKELGLEVRGSIVEVYATNRLMLPALVIGLLVLYGAVETFVGVEITNANAVHWVVWLGCVVISLIWICNVSRLAQLVHLNRQTLRQCESRLGIKGHRNIYEMDKKSLISQILRHNALRFIGFWIYFSLILYFPLKSINCYEMLISRLTIIGSGLLSIGMWYFYFKQPFRTSSKTPTKWWLIVTFILLLIPLAHPILDKVTGSSIHNTVLWIGIEAFVAGLLICIWILYFKKHPPSTSNTPIKWYHIAIIIIVLISIIGSFTFFLENLQTHSDPNTYLMRGLKHYAKGNFEDANEAYKKAINLDSEYAPAYALRGLEHSAKGDDEKSNADWTKAKALRNAR